MPVLWTVTSLQKEPGLEGTMCPIACDPTEYHTWQMLKICQLVNRWPCEPLGSGKIHF